jgi:hypothetical protein
MPCSVAGAVLAVAGRGGRDVRRHTQLPRVLLRAEGRRLHAAAQRDHL